ncbi:hypothetical protein [Pontibacter beigongshangensis]|uniref:hypothetical protein n=1 Tax=Pontibacter beigongshangensis TaxID=2574733 RepID=UPI00164F86EB|nr:hypothetical protein [Pontibacter beigongshangensis]
MKKTILSLMLMLLLLLAGCTTPPSTQSHSPQSFYNSLAVLCGKSFRGTVVHPADGTDPFAGKALVMHVQTCSDTTLRVPFTVGEDKSRTWLIRKTPEGLQLKHDHRHEDGTPDEITMYGGISTAPAESLTHSFPADAHTAQLLPAAATNEWTLAISPDGSTFSYILKRDNQLRFQADFDLTKPLE